MTAMASMRRRDRVLPDRDLTRGPYLLACSAVNMDGRHSLAGPARGGIRAASLGRDPISDRTVGLGAGSPAMNDVTRILSAIEHGDPEAAEQLLPLVYDELRRLAAQRLAARTPGQTLQATALVHEAYLRLVGPEDAPRWDSRGHFFAAAAEAMRRILVENARRKRAEKHGGGLRTPGPRRGGDRGRRPLRGPPGPRRGADEARGRGPGQGRAGQAPLLRRPVRRGGRPRRSASPAQRPIATGITPRSGCSASCGGRRARAKTPEFSPAREARRPRFLALPYGADRSTTRGPWHGPGSSEHRRDLLRRPRGRGARGPRGLPRRGLRPRCRPAASRRAHARREPPGRAASSSPRPPTPTVTADSPPPEMRGHGHRPLQAAGADRRGGHGRRLHGRADPARSAARWP